MGIKGLILEITQLKVSFVKINEIEKKVLTQISRKDIILCYEDNVFDTYKVVGMVKRLTRRIVVSVTRGFDPPYSPHNLHIVITVGCSRVVRQTDFDSVMRWFDPATPANMTH